MIILYINAIGFISMAIGTDEEWRSIPGYEGFYSISSFGRARSEDRTITEKNTGKRVYVPGKMLKLVLNNVGKGYYKVTLSKGSKLKAGQIHQLVCQAFYGPQAKGIEVRHLDGNCRNNLLNNLCYGTKTENIKDAKFHGVFPMHERRPGAILTRGTAIEACKRGLKGESANTLAKEFGVTPGTIRQVWAGAAWSEFTEGIRPKRDFRKLIYLDKKSLNFIMDKSNSLADVAKKFDIHYSTAKHWRRKLIAKT
jgi:NUMOD4 motif-containing protein/HNH endonuclease